MTRKLMHGGMLVVLVCMLSMYKPTRVSAEETNDAKKFWELMESVKSLLNVKESGEKETKKVSSIEELKKEIIQEPIKGESMSLEVISPAKGSEIKSGSLVSIHVTRKDIGHSNPVTIEVWSGDERKKVTTLVENKIINEVYRWEVENIPIGTYVIKVSSQTPDTRDMIVGKSDEFEVVNANEKKDETPRVAFLSDKVNQVYMKGQWQSDYDASSNAGVNKLEYCRKWYPRTVRVEVYEKETIYDWKDRGNENSYTAPATSYKCVEEEIKRILPDLVVVDVNVPFVKWGEVESKEQVFEAIIKNRGEVRSGNFTIQYENKTVGSKGGKEEVWALNREEVVKSVIPKPINEWTKEGVNEICTTVDPENNITESNEKNNVLCKKIVVNVNNENDTNGVTNTTPKEEVRSQNLWEENKKDETMYSNKGTTKQTNQMIKKDQPKNIASLKDQMEIALQKFIKIVFKSE